MPNRKKPFSGKQKKVQLQLKKQEKGSSRRSESDKGEKEDSELKIAVTSDKNDVSGSCSFRSADKSLLANRQVKTDRYALKFRTQTKESAEFDKNKTYQPIMLLEPECLECQIEDYFISDLQIPIRPAWNYSLSKDELETQEKHYFNEYLHGIEGKKLNDLSYFEMNLETWRQLWRVLEMSDIILIILDIRYCALLFPPHLYEYILQLGKTAIVILNKIDLVPPSLVLAWKRYFKSKYSELEVVYFTSCPNLQSDAGVTKKTKKPNWTATARCAKNLFNVCERLVGTDLDLTQWKDRIEKLYDNDVVELTKLNLPNETVVCGDSGEEHAYKKYAGKTLTLGCVGQPNVGKSSVINGLMGRKVVSVSKTPESLLVLCGSFPIAQLRNPVAVLRYLAERTKIPQILGLNLPDGVDVWSAAAIAEAWAIKRGFVTAKASRPDTYRAANHILRCALEGKICLSLRPPGYTKDAEKWNSDPEFFEVKALQTAHQIDHIAREGITRSEASELDLTSEEDDSNEDEEKWVLAEKNMFGILANSD